MRVTRSLKTVARLGLMVLASTFALSSLANATSSRTFVASTGNDTNTASSCGLTTPCRTFAGAYSVTVAGGEIIALDTAGYGTVSITTPVSIIGTPQGAEVTVGTSGTGITVNVSAGTTVILRNIVLNGGNATNSTGLSVTDGTVVFENSTAKFLNTGILIDGTGGGAVSKVAVINSDIIGNATGIHTNGLGADLSSTPVYNNADAYLYGSTNVIGNTTAFFMQNVGTVLHNGLQSNQSILQYATSVINVIGNGLLVNGSGTGCASGSTQSNNGQCFNTGSYGSLSSDSQTSP